MIFSIALILLGGFLGGLLLQKIKIPKIIGMILFGFLIGPYCLQLLDDKMIGIAADLRQIALVVILTRSGLSLDIKSLKQIGRPALLMCFVPATLEIIGISIFGPMLLGISFFEALLLGTVLGAVSPAIIVPRMIRLQKEHYGQSKRIPEMILAGSSADDIFVIVLFYAFLGLVDNHTFDVKSIVSIPVSILLGIILGGFAGVLLTIIFKKYKMSTTIKILIIFSVTLLMVFLENRIKNYLPVSALLGVISLGMVLLFRQKEVAKEVEQGYQHIWTFFEIILFVLVGSSVNMTVAFDYGIPALLLLFIALLFRTFGVFLCLIKTNLTLKEKVFACISYIPKATVQASIGGIALAYGLPCGDLILAVAVLSIIITAPLGAILMDCLYKKLLTKEEPMALPAS